MGHYACQAIRGEDPNSVALQIGGPNLAVLDGASSGIRFGAEGLTIGLQVGNERQAKSRLGSYYAKLPNGGRSLFAAPEKTKTELTDLRVSCPSPRMYLKVCAARPISSVLGL